MTINSILFYCVLLCSVVLYCVLMYSILFSSAASVLPVCWRALGITAVPPARPATRDAIVRGEGVKGQRDNASLGLTGHVMPPEGACDEVRGHVVTH